MRGWLRLPALRLGAYSNGSVPGGRSDGRARSPGSSTSNSVRRAGIQGGPRRLVDDGDAERVQQRPEGALARVEERVRGVARGRHPDDAGQGTEPIPVLQRDGVDGRLTDDTEHLPQDGRREVGHVAPRRDRQLAGGRLQAPRQSGERALPLARVADEPRGGSDRHRRLRLIGGDHHDDLPAHLAEPRDGVMQQRNASIRRGELVAAEPRGAPSREHDPRRAPGSLTQTSLASASSRPGRRPSATGRTRTRTAP